MNLEKNTEKKSSIAFSEYLSESIQHHAPIKTTIKIV